MTKEQFIKYCNITDDQFSGREKIEGNLNLVDLTSIPEGFNPKVGGSLYLRDLTEIPEGFNPVVGNDLFLNGLKEIPENLNLSKVIWCVYIGAGSGDDDGNGKLFENIKPMLEFINFQI